jgi:hypothetical protein
MIAQSGGFPDCLVDDRLERGDPPDELPPDRLVSGRSGPASDKVPVNRPVMAANRAASRRRAPPRSVPASTMPAQTMPMQISLARVTASRKACPFRPPVAPSWSLATTAAV